MGKIKKTENSVFSWRSKNPFGLELQCKYTSFFPSRKVFSEYFPNNKLSTSNNNLFIN